MKPEPLLSWAETAWAKDGPMWLVQDLILAQGLHVISGVPKLSWKSWLWQAMVQALTSGESPWGLRAARPVNTLSVALEGPEKTTAGRMLSLYQSSGVKYKANAWWSHMQGQALDSNKDVTALCQFVADNNIEVICFDTFSKAISRGSENDAQIINAVLRNALRIQRLGCAVVLIHHTRKPSRDEDLLEIDIDQALRGSNALSGGYDVHMGIIPTGPGEMQLVRRCKEAEEKRFQLRWSVSGPEDMLKEISFNIMEWDESADLARKAEKAFDDIMPGTKLSIKKLKLKTGLDEEELKEYVDGLCIAGRLEPTGKPDVYVKVA